MRKVRGGMAMGLALVLGLVCLWQMTPTSAAHAQGGRQWVGVSMPSRAAAVGPEQSGVIVEMPKLEGQRVAEGDILFRLSSELEAFEVERLESLVASKAAIEKAQRRFEYTEVVEKRLLQLMVKEIASDAELQEARNARMMAKSDYELARLEQNMQAIRLKQAKVRLAQRTVRSPVSGVVVAWNKQPGEAADKLAPVVEVACLDPLWVAFDCPLRDQRLFPLGAEVTVAPALEPNNERKAKVVFVSMRATPSSHTFRVRLSTANGARDWKAGQKMLIRIDEPRAQPPAGK
jgi:RND family efflux transporter MFP subunit